jgi:hypothetical protein
VKAVCLTDADAVVIASAAQREDVVYPTDFDDLSRGTDRVHR